jgi:hypothetical protein
MEEIIDLFARERFEGYVVKFFQTIALPKELLTTDLEIMYSGAGNRDGHSRGVADIRNVAGNELFTNLETGYIKPKVSGLHISRKNGNH